MGPYLAIIGPVVSCVVSLLVVLVVFFRSSRRITNQLIGAIALAAFHYNFFRILFFWVPLLFVVKIGWIGALLLIPLLIEFPNVIVQGRLTGKKIRAVGVLLTSAFLMTLPGRFMFRDDLRRIGDDLIAVAGPAMKVYALVMAVLLVRIGWKLLRAWYSTKDELLARRLEFILLGAAFYSLCALHDMLLRHEVFYLFSFPIVDWATLAFMLIVVYATMRYRLVDIDVVLGMGVYYMLLTLGTALTYKSVEIFLENTLEQAIQMQAWWAKLLPAMFVAMCIGPVLWIIQWVIDRLFLSPEIRHLQVFRSPNFQFLALDSKVDDLRKLRAELDELIDWLERHPDAAGGKPPVEALPSPTGSQSPRPESPPLAKPTPAHLARPVE